MVTRYHYYPGEAQTDEHMPNGYAQRTYAGARLNLELRKYIQAQYMITQWAPPEDLGRYVAMPHDKLYKLMGQIGYVWVPSSKYWKRNRQVKFKSFNKIYKG